MLSYHQVQDLVHQWLLGQWVRVNSFLRGGRKHDTDLEESEKKIMKTNKEKFVEIDGRIKLVNQKIDLIIKKPSSSHEKRH